MYPVLISSLGIAVGIVTLVLRTVTYKLHDDYGAAQKSLKGILTISTVLMSPVWCCRGNVRAKHCGGTKLGGDATVKWAMRRGGRTATASLQQESTTRHVGISSPHEHPESL